jgi:hypothetical protein
VIKTAAIFPSQSAQNSRPVLDAMIRSMSAHGWQIRENDLRADVAVIWSVLWWGRMKNNQNIYRVFQDTGRPVIVVDIGTLRRGLTWKVALGNINGSGWFGHHQDLDLDRPRKLGISLKSSHPGKDILIASQHSASLQAKNIPDMTAWVRSQIDLVRQHTDRQIVIRPHPRDRLIIDRLHRDISIHVPDKITGSYDDFGWPSGFHAVINHNSGPGVLAALSGSAPVVDRSSLAWPVSVSMQDIDRPYDRDRSQWLIEIAHTEYTINEIDQGLWLKRLSDKLQ